MKRLHSILITLAFGCVFIINVRAVKSSPPANDYANLQVLPKDISTKELQRIMVDEFQDGLGVGCGYCHATKKGTILLDYASDEKPEKEITRKMMRMTMDINKTHFGLEKVETVSSLMPVTCSTCHRGKAHPENE
ncbi:hypothetical protein WSM22_40190 [Cytophagales bacterium WSM2-2]|nr:hypothetical protein WSM22_40190 [Cytophagales bacterium WSM2-2]